MEEGLDVEECAGYCGQMLELCEKMGRADLARYCHARCVPGAHIVMSPISSIHQPAQAHTVLSCVCVPEFLHQTTLRVPGLPSLPSPHPDLQLCPASELQTRSTHSYNRPSQASTGAKQQNTSLCGKYTREQCFTGGKQPSLTNFKLIMSLHLRNCSRKYRDTLTPI